MASSAASIPLSTQTPISNESTSVLFWGYWKKVGEITVTPTDTVTTATTDLATPELETSPRISVFDNPTSNIVQSIKPASFNNINIE